MSDPKTKSAVDETVPTQYEPYPTGNPPEPLTFADFHPQEARASELNREAPAAAKAEPKAAKVEPEEEEENNRSGKGRK